MAKNKAKPAEEIEIADAAKAEEADGLKPPELSEFSRLMAEAAAAVPTDGTQERPRANTKGKGGFGKRYPETAKTFKYTPSPRELSDTLTYQNASAETQKRIDLIIAQIFKLPEEQQMELIGQIGKDEMLGIKKIAQEMAQSNLAAAATSVDIKVREFVQNIAADLDDLPEIDPVLLQSIRDMAKERDIKFPGNDASNQLLLGNENPGAGASKTTQIARVAPRADTSPKRGFGGRMIDMVFSAGKYVVDPNGTRNKDPDETELEQALDQLQAKSDRSAQLLKDLEKLLREASLASNENTRQLKGGLNEIERTYDNVNLSLAILLEIEHRKHTGKPSAPAKYAMTGPDERGTPDNLLALAQYWDATGSAEAVQDAAGMVNELLGISKKIDHVIDSKSFAVEMRQLMRTTLENAREGRQEMENGLNSSISRFWVVLGTITSAVASRATVKAAHGLNEANSQLRRQCVQSLAGLLGDRRQMLEASGKNLKDAETARKAYQLVIAASVKPFLQTVEDMGRLRQDSLSSIERFRQFGEFYDEGMTRQVMEALVGKFATPDGLPPEALADASANTAPALAAPEPAQTLNLSPAPQREAIPVSRIIDAKAVDTAKIAPMPKPTKPRSSRKPGAAAASGAIDVP